VVADVVFVAVVMIVGVVHVHNLIEGAHVRFVVVCEAFDVAEVLGTHTVEETCHYTALSCERL
jgi:hypothetical protein